MMRVPSRGQARKAAAVLAAFFLCAASASAAGSESIKSRAPVFLHGGAVWSAAAAVPEILFDAGSTVRSRSVSAHPSGILLFDSATRRLSLKDTSGAELGSARLDGAYAWLSENRALARSDLYDEKSGFEFTLYAVSGTLPFKLEKRWTAKLDCFVSDLAFAPGGALYLAGGNGADSAHRVYRIDETGAVTKILDLPWQGFFIRLVASGGNIIAFGSGGDKNARSLKIWTGKDDGRVLAETKVEGLPEKSLTWFGFGFPFPSIERHSAQDSPAPAAAGKAGAGDAVIPLARADGSVSLVRISLSGEGRAKADAAQAAVAPAAAVATVAAVAERSGGCFLPVGAAGAAGMSGMSGTSGAAGKGASLFRYIAHDPVSAPGSFSLATYDGERISFSPLPPLS